MKSDTIFSHPLRSKRFLIGVISLFMLTAAFTLNGFAQSISASAEKIQSDLIIDKNAEEISGELSLNQSSNNLITATTYAFSTTTGTLEDMSTGTTQIVAASSDDGNSTLQNIGFEFWYDGVRFTQFGANANGFIRLGLAPTGTSFNNATGFASTTNAPKIAAFYDDLCVGANGKVHYKTVGSAPNRKLVVEYQNMQITRGAGCAGDGGGTFQLWLFESAGATSPGAIQFVYGNGMVAAATVDAGYTVGLQSGAATNFASVTTLSDTVSYDTANNSQLDAITAGKSYLFTPNVPTAPSGLNFTAVTALSQTLNWTDNSSNEFGFAVYRSTDGTNYTFVNQTAANATSFNDTGLLPGTNYFYRVYAVSEGALSSPALSGSQMTAPAGNDTCAGAGGNWSNTATWTDGTVPTATDNVTIGSGCTVTVDVTTAVAFSVTINSGGTLQSPTTGTVTNNNLTVSTNVTNNGTLDFSTNGDTSGAILTFGAGSQNVSFSGTGAITDVRAITIAKGAQATVVELSTSNFTVQGVSTDVAGFLTLTSGTFKISGTFTAANRVFTAAGYSIPALGGIWLNNPNFTVSPQNGSPTVTGLFRITQGTYNIGTSTGNSMGFAAGSNIIVEGGTVNASGRFGVNGSANIFSYTQSGGTITVCTVGNTSTTLGSFDLGTSTSSTISITGGTIVNQLAATTIDYRNQAGSGIAGVTGGTLQLGNADSGAAKNFSIRGVIPNLVITNTSANHTATFGTIATYNHITLNITINPGNTLTLGNNVFLFAGATLTNNGTLTHTGASARFITFSSTVPQSYTGTGTVTSPMNSFEFQSDQGFTFDPAIPQIVTNRVINFIGNVTNSSKLTVGSGGSSTATVQIGNTTTPTAAGIFDSQLGFDPGTGGTNITYLRTTASRVTGGEVPATRTINNLTYDDNDPMHTLTIAGGNLTANGTLTLTNGVVLTGMNTLIHNGTAARTNGYVDGNLSRSYTATGAYTYHVGQNGYSPVIATISALGTNPSSLTVKPNDAILPGLAPATAVSRNWTLTEGGDLTADLTFTYIDPDDVNGNEANYKVFRREMGVTTEVTPNTNNPAANTASVTGVSTFSDWGVGEAILVLTPPTISDIADQTILEDANTGALAFTVGDAETAPADLSVSGSSSNPVLVPNGNIVFGGSGANRTVTVTPLANQSGTATITVTVTDADMMTAQDTFLLTVTAVNDAPTLDAIGDVTIPQDSGAQTVNLTGISAGGGETQVLSVSASSSNTALIPNPTVTYTSPNATGSISFTPVAGQSGSATITVTVMDDGGTSNGGVNTFSRMFTVTVTPPVSGNVTVNPGNVNYATLKQAFDAINAGTHTGAVTIDINSNTTETESAVLNSSGAGSASYTSIVIRPSADGVTIAGPSIQGRGLIELNGADNVTIDGDNPNTTGTNRNLTIQNTAANTVNFASVIRIAMNTTTVNSADNNAFKNLNIVGSATGRNIPTETSTTLSPANTTFGILAAANASGATTAPQPVVSVSTTVGTGATAANLLVSNNSFATLGRGVSVNGSATTVFPGVKIQDNAIGNPMAGDADQVYNHGIFAQGTSNGLISGNTIYVEGYIGSSGTSATAGINVGSGSAASTFTIEKNKVLRVRNNNEQSWATQGINLGGGNNHIVQNNFVSDVKNSQVAGTGAFSTTFGVFGLRVGSGTGHKIYHNSVNLFGMIPGVVNTNLTAAVAIVGTGQTGVDMRNNIFVNTLTGGNPTGTRNVAFYITAGGTSTMNLTLNNNDYFVGSDAQNRLAQRGTTFGTGEFTLADFDPTMTTPATNFRSYTSTLSTAGTNDDSTKKVDPVFVSNTDLHIQTSSPMQAMGANVAVTDDIDGEMRQTPSDIGADEIIGVVTMPGSLQFSSATYSGGEAGSPFTVTVTRTGGSDGTVTVDFATSNGTATGGAACTAGVDYINNSGTLTFANGVTTQTFDVVICNDTIDEPDETINYTLTNPTGGATLGTPNTAVQTIIDDDVSSPMFTYTISDVRVTEGDSGSVNATFNVTLSSIAPPDNLGSSLASVQYATANGTATAGADYTATSGTLNFNSTGTQTVTVPVIGDTVKEANETFFVNLSNPSPNATITDGQGLGIIVDRDRAYLGDFDNDKLTDFSVYRMGIKNAWYIFQSSSGQTRIDSVGGAGDLPVPGDYDGDGKVDIALFKPADGDWYITSSLTNTLQVIHWGSNGDKPVQGDYDGDGKTDQAVYRPSDGTWYVRLSTGSSTITQFGISTDQPVVGDFDGDFKADKTVYRDGVWYILQSSTATARIEGWGIAADKPVSGDFDGDGKTDLGIFRPSTGTWWILDSLNGNYRVIPWGVDGDIPVVADYDGDGTSDVAVFRPSGGDWYVLRSSDFLFTGVHWGQNGDIPVPAAYTPQQ